MARNNRPALTSPWKIGFLVSLLVVATSIGVGVFITRMFGLSWTWLEFGGQLTSWTFHRDAFLSEMLPLVVLVPIFALVGYFLIASGVRRYREYIDSGADYKRLIKSLRKIEDLEDDRQIRSLNGHPELRDFLTHLRKSVVERQKSLDARNAELEGREAEAADHDALESDVDALVSAIQNGHNGDRELEMSVPELKRVENAVRERLALVKSQSDEQMTELRNALSESSGALRDQLEEICSEMGANEQNAREIETEMSDARGQSSKDSPGPADESGVAERAIARLDSVSEVLGALGEETRKIAINTALHAGAADATVEGVVHLADDVREVAAKFNGVAAQWEEASEVARHAFTAAAPVAGTDGDSLDALSGKIGLWVERTVLLSEKLKGFERHYQDALAALEGAEPADEVETDVDELDTSSDWTFESNNAEAANDAELTNETEATGQVELESEVDVTDEVDVEPLEAEAGPVIDLETTPGTNDATSTFEKQESLFSDISGGADAPDDEMFADMPPAAPEVHEEAPVDEIVEPVVNDEGDREYVIDDTPAPNDFQTSSAIDDVIAGANLASDAPAPVEPALPDVETPSESLDDAIDLYALGAVDYEPENVHHNA